jgi:hypothetical protein
MDAVLTSWAFGFGAWIGVFGSTFLFLNAPHSSTLLTLLLSPWLGGIGLYILMFVTHAWINVSVQVLQSMKQYEIILAVLTSCLGVMVVAIARLVIEMDRGHRTAAQAAAEESSSETVHSETQTTTESEAEESEAEESEAEESESESDKEEGSTNDDGSDADAENSSEKGSKESGSEVESENTEETTHTNETHDVDNIVNNENKTNLNDAIIEDSSSSSSYENINTPQLGPMTTCESPIPKMPDI